MELRVCTYNCCSAKSNFERIRNLCVDNYDIIFLQETFLVADKLGILDQIHGNYNVIAVAAQCSDRVLESMHGRPSGGLAVLFKKDLNFTFEIIDTNFRFIICNCKFDTQNIIVANIYMPYDDRSSECIDNYLHVMALIENTLDNYKYDGVYICGDFNADPFGSRLWRYVTDFSEDLNLVCYDYDILDNNTFTYISNSHMYKKWIDHVIGTKNEYFYIDYINVRYDIVGSDHIPLECTITCNIVNSCKNYNNSANDNSHNNNKNYINWEKVNKNTMEIISKSVYKNIEQAVNDLKFYDCDAGAICNNQAHMKVIDDLYGALVDEINVHMKNLGNNIRNGTHDNNYTPSNNKVKLGTHENTCNVNMSSDNNTGAQARTHVPKKLFTPVPGWNRRVKSLYKQYRDDFLRWVRSGRSRFCFLFFEMQVSRSLFKTAYAECKLDKIKEIANSITEKYKNKNSKEFWEDINKNKKISKKTNIIDGKTSEHEICKVFYDLYFDFEKDENFEFNENQFVSDLLAKMQTDRCMYLKTSTNTIKSCIKRLNDGVGHDNIHAKFLKHASDDFILGLSLFFNACNKHGHYPLEMLKGVVKPRLKNSSGNCTDHTNYRPIMQSSNLLKIAEFLILNILEEKIFINPRQFGYSRGVSTADATLVLKETIYQSINNNENVYALFLDLSKAFDRVDHFKLAHILLQKNIPPDIVWILLKFLRNQTAVVQWGKSYSHTAYLNMGCRQGGILSPFLFKLYIDSILNEIGALDEGVKFNFCKVNILGYADDLVLMSRTIKGLNTMYKILKSSLDSLELKININKTKIMRFSKENSKDLPSHQILGNDSFEYCDTFKYLGFHLTYNLNDVTDVEKRLKDFYAKFYSVKSNFSILSEDIFLFLFKSYCTPNYGVNIWNLQSTYKIKEYNAFKIAYSNAVKRIYNLNKFYSSHQIFNACHLLMLDHHINFVQCRYFVNMYREPKGLLYLLPGVVKQGVIFNSLSRIFKNTYGVSILDNDLDALKSRVIFVQQNNG